MRRSFLAVGGLVVASAAGAQAGEPYQQVVAKTAGMVGDSAAQRLAQQHGLQVLNVTWEDTGRFKGSSVGDNISDMTIQVMDQGRITCMPVIRAPNFSDRTGDVKIDDFKLLVGNERSGETHAVTLREYLGNLRRYMTNPLEWTAKQTSLLSDRDTHVLVSAQACFLPVPREGKAKFNPVLFNYQSYPGQPAVLAILVTREGTSATIIDNQRDTWGYGQRVFFNLKGEKTALTGERLSDFTDAQEAKERAGDATAVKKPSAALSEVLLIQVPLKQAPRPRRDNGGMQFEACKKCCDAPGAARAPSDVEAAVIGHGEAEGPFVEIPGLAIERDERFPVRVTVQFYKATSNGVVSEKDMAEIAGQIESVYAKADVVGSLVTEGDTGRVTEHGGRKLEPAGWWEDFWSRRERETGVSRASQIEQIRRVLGADYAFRDEAELAKATTLYCSVEVGGERPIPVRQTPPQLEPRPMPIDLPGPGCTPVERAAPFLAAGALGTLLLGFVLVLRR